MEKRNTISGCITAGIWGVLILVMALVPASSKEQEPQFKEIAIQLEPMQAKEEKTQEVPQVQKAVAESPSPAVSEPVVQETAPVQETQVAKVETPKPEPVKKAEPVAKTEPAKKAEPAKKTETTQKAQPVQKTEPVKKEEPTPAPQKLVKSVEELMAEQNAKKPATSSESVDWDAMFADSSTETSSSSEKVKRTVSGTSGVSGTAATTTAADTGVTTTSAKQKTDSADAALSQRLATVNKNWTAPAGGGMTAEVSVAASSSSGTGVSVVLEDGTARKLIMPAAIKPDISEYASLIEGQPEVTIRFEISPEGTVSKSSISVSAGLPPQVVEVIKQYLSSELWFEQASTYGIATFNYRITRQ